MADWKQITARIRRARSGKDPLGQLATLYQKTNDAMVAFELAKQFESSGQNSDAAKWYSTAAARFRRADWKTKAQEAAVRLGGVPGEITAEVPQQPAGEFQLTSPSTSPEEKKPPLERNPEVLESVVAVTSEIQQAAENPPGLAPQARGRRHRGRRGGRNRRRSPAAVSNAASQPATRIPGNAVHHELPPAAIQAPTDLIPPRLASSRAIPSLPVEPIEEPSEPAVKGRYGDPGLSSRISLLEMQFRRLMTCPPVKLSEADRAPAGPGVFVLTDSDLTTYYYVEACQTLRIATGNLIRGGSRRGADSIKPRLANHLGIPETRVTKYLADHCVVRWLQLDEGASNFAHFAIAVLRPVLNE